MNFGNRILFFFYGVPYFFLLFLGFLSVIYAFPTLAFGDKYTITYAKNTRNLKEGNEYLQVIFIRVPENINETLYIRLSYPKCGGNLTSEFSEG